MKTKIIMGSLLAVTLFMASCKKELQPQESATPAEATTDATAPGQAPVVGQPQQVQPQQPVQVQQPQQTQQQPVAATAPGMNPPHGQPGHRCDIAVGAPLNSPPAQKPAATPAAVTAQKPAPAASNSTMIPSNTGGNAVAAGINPPHGMPGHRCDIAVGQPLPKA